MGSVDDTVVESEENLALPPPPVVIPNNVKLEMPLRPKYEVMTRRGIGRSGKRIPLHANHFKVSVDVPDAVFYQYTVSICYEDDKEANVKGIGRQLMNKLYQTYSSEFSGKKFAYDGEKSLYTVGPLPQNKFEFTVVLEESSAAKLGDGNQDLTESPKEGGKRSKRSFNSKTFKIELSYAAKIPMKSIALALKGADADHSTQDALRVLDIILRQQAANRGCLLVRQSFFHDDVRNFTDVGGGVSGVRGFHASFRTTQDGLSLNMDVSTTMILRPGPVTDFLRANQGVRENRYIDWVKAKRMLKNMRIKTSHQSMEFKIIGLSELPCNKLFFPLKVKNGGDVETDGQTQEITVYEYFTKHRNIELGESAYMPCLIVGRPKKPNYLPIELCTLVSLQRYTKALSSVQRTALVEKSRQKPQEKTEILVNAIRNYKYDNDPLLGSCGISIEKQFIQLEGRVLDPPKLKFGQNSESFPSNGRWNFNNKTVFDAVRIDKWIVVNFSARCDMSQISRDLISCGRKKGIQIEGPFTLIDEEQSHRRASPVARVEKMFERIRAKVPGPPTFILCILSERKTCDVYGPWKKKCLSDFGIVTQCISPFKVNDQYLTNVLLKINAKLGGMNSMLAIEHPSRIPVISDTPTLILGMDVSHGSPGRSDLPSIAAVVGSRYWPSISKYGASVRTQSPKTEMIDALYKPLPNGNDDGIISELLVDFYQTSNRKPSQIVIFRDGVSESQFNQVLNIELDQIIQAYHHLKETNIPKFTVIVAQKNHHTKLFQASDPSKNNMGADPSKNIPPGTIVDTRIVHPRNNDFYLCSHMGMIGTSRPAHYHVLLDEIGFSPDDLQNLIHSLSYVYQRSTTAISIVAPICYAHLAAYQMGQFIKFEDLSDTASGQKSASSAGTIHVPELPRLHENIKGSMFFC